MRYVEVLTPLSMAVIAENRPYVQQQFRCTGVDRRYEKLKCDQTLVQNVYGDELAKFGRANQNMTSSEGCTPPLETRHSRDKQFQSTPSILGPL